MKVQGVTLIVALALAWAAAPSMATEAGLLGDLVSVLSPILPAPIAIASQLNVTGKVSSIIQSVQNLSAALSNVLGVVSSDAVAPLVSSVTGLVGGVSGLLTTLLGQVGSDGTLVLGEATVDLQQLVQQLEASLNLTATLVR